jgi:hypothetical protein
MYISSGMPLLRQLDTNLSPEAWVWSQASPCMNSGEEKRHWDRDRFLFQHFNDPPTHTLFSPSFQQCSILVFHSCTTDTTQSHQPTVLSIKIPLPPLTLNASVCKHHQSPLNYTWGDVNHISTAKAQIPHNSMTINTANHNKNCTL